VEAEQQPFEGQKSWAEQQKQALEPEKKQGRQKQESWID
jgi:hypothetical protein